MVIADECHHSGSIVFMQCGPIRYKSDARAQMSRQSFIRVLIPKFTPFRAIEEKGNGLQYLGDLANDRARNELIVQDVVSELNEGRTPIILTKRKDHISFLADMLAPYEMLRTYRLCQAGD